MLPSATLPNCSVETTCLMLGANRCSLIASAEASISREVETLNWANCTTSPPLGDAPSASVSSVIFPAVTWTERTSRGRPV